MPKFSEAQSEGTVVEWLKKEGEKVEKGEPIVEIFAEKVTYDLEAPASGVLLKILAPPNSVVPVTEAIAFIGEPGEALPEITVRAEEAEKPVKPVEVKVKKAKIAIRASPAAKRLARQYNINLTQVEGTGPEGRITREDVKAFIEKRRPARKVREIIPLIGVRRVTAERMAHSARSAPHVTLVVEIDVSEMVKLRQRMTEEAKVTISYMDILVKATAKALEENPILNSTLEEGQIKVFEDINVGVAVDTEKGLVVPVVRNANKKALAEIASALKALVKRAREGTLTEADLTGGTFTVTNLGMFEVDAFMPIINPPESAILGVGRINEKPVVRNGKIEVRPMACLCLSFDHRVVDGAPAARFLQGLKRILENPSELRRRLCSND